MPTFASDAPSNQISIFTKLATRISLSRCRTSPNARFRCDRARDLACRAIYQSDLEKGLRALNDAYRVGRPVETRVSDLTYAPFDKTRGKEPAIVDTLELNRAERFLSDAAKDRPGAASFHGLGKFYLLRSGQGDSVPGTSKNK